MIKIKYLIYQLNSQKINKICANIGILSRKIADDMIQVLEIFVNKSIAEIASKTNPCAIELIKKDFMGTFLKLLLKKNRKFLGV